MRDRIWHFLLTGLIFIVQAAQAMPVKSQMLKPKAFFQEADNNLFEPLDLKAKTLSLTKADMDACGLRLFRQSHTLTYSCTLSVPSSARISKLQTLESLSEIAVDFGSSRRKVYVNVSEDARALTLSTSFDSTGIDFEVSKFNDDFFKVYDKVAVLVMTEALSKNPVRIQVLEAK